MRNKLRSLPFRSKAWPRDGKVEEEAEEEEEEEEDLRLPVWAPRGGWD
ncbi:hypothetical protein E2C01_100167 [Portunus trituberculatus]|uniref:Uncharacterized protein n=1 Tax=Portunus trituberculatus TaxID=210409 RepID=A0A5B7KCU6_PORTR|nr:hypothetical protein [Portunus trituberculatus]